MEDAFWLVSLPSPALLLLQAAAVDGIDVVVPIVSAAALDILQSIEHTA
jgi:hypothetical protein